MDKGIPRLIIIYGLCVLSIAGPCLAVALASSRISLRQQQDRAETIAADILRRALRVSAQTRASFAALRRSPDGIVCSESHIELMRQIVVKSYLLLDVGIARDDQLLCSSFGKKPVNIGSPSYLSATGNLIRNNVGHPMLLDGKMLIITEATSGVSVEIHEDTILDVSPVDSGLVIGLVGWSKRHIMMRRGDFDFNRIRGPDSEFDGFSYDGRSLIAWKRSTNADFAAVVVVGSSEILASWRQVAWMIAPLGILTCLSLLFVVRQFVRQQASLPTRIKRGLEREQFFLVYQPIVELATGRTVGAEALVRWRLDDGDLIGPDIFIPEAERHHLIEKITERVITLFERDAAGLLTRNPDIFIALNFSAEDLCSSDLCFRLRQCISRMGIQPGQLHVEATERVFINHERVNQNLKALNVEGIPTAIDDFGTGYSSLAYLTSLQVNCLKIDKAFIDTIGMESVTSHVVNHIIEMAKSLNLEMVAEGVEAEQQAIYLREHGVKFAQGWLFSKPLSIEQFTHRVGETGESK